MHDVLLSCCDIIFYWEVHVILVCDADMMAFHLQECSSLAHKLSEFETQQKQESNKRQEQQIEVLMRSLHEVTC